ncbi:hypothetical protein EVAR_5453_1 [Eumeta japonica]|uniref:Uncharacterized protein n=1 Tax=Eumeta variegata TaxID=151549 RepID=A0A4C1T8P0_EUMVA|nr:hypothetical protein EVAR_5453_1 [Eumeta japonica]
MLAELRALTTRANCKQESAEQLQRTKLCCSELLANDAMRSIAPHNPSFFSPSILFYAIVTLSWLSSQR